VYRHLVPFKPSFRRGDNASPEEYAHVSRISFTSADFGCEPGLAASAAGVELATQIGIFAGGSRMGEFAATLQHRLREAHASLRAALAAGDADLTDTQLDEIEHLRRIATAHGISEPARA